MAENDIYNNQELYYRFLESVGVKKNDLIRDGRQSIFYDVFQSLNISQSNSLYFKRLATEFEKNDISYIRRLKYMRILKYVIESNKSKDIKKLNRDDIDSFLVSALQSYKAKSSRQELIRSIKYLWKTLIPEEDEKGRIDHTIVPYVVRHLKVTHYNDKSREKRRKDLISYDDLTKLLNYFHNDIRLQAYIMIAFETLARPQELLYRRIKDLDMFENYAKLHISDHGKVGIGMVAIIDSYAYLLKWLDIHPRKDDPEAWLFSTTAKNKTFSQLTNANINKHLRIACKHLGIKQITCYSLKRNGVTFRRLRGDSDAEIQHIARWTSTKQLQTYDKSDQEDILKIQLAKRGLLKEDKLEFYYPKERECVFCSAKNPFHKEFCDTCKRPLDTTKIKEMDRTREVEFIAMKRNIEILQRNMHKIQNLLKTKVVKG